MCNFLVNKPKLRQLNRIFIIVVNELEALITELECLLHISWTKDKG